MQKNTVILSVVAAVAAIYGIKKVSSNAKKYAFDIKKEELANDISLEDSEALEKYGKMLEKCHQIDKSLNKNHDIKVSEAKKSIGYEARLAGINTEHDAQLEAFKDSINYKADKALYSNFAKNQTEDYKKSIGYDKQVKDINDKIEKTKRDYDRSKSLVSIVGDEESDEQIRKILKDGKNEKIKNLKKDLKELDEKVESYRKEAEKIANEKLMDLEQTLAEFKSKNDKVRSDMRKQLDDELYSKIKNVDSEFIETLSDEDYSVYLDHDFALEQLEIITSKHDAKVMDAVDSMEDAEKIALYLKSKNVSKTTVLGVSAIPVIPVVLGLKWYIKNVKDVLRYM